MEEIDKVYLSRALSKMREAANDIRRIQHNDTNITHLKIFLEKAIKLAIVALSSK